VEIFPSVETDGNEGLAILQKRAVILRSNLLDKNQFERRFLKRSSLRGTKQSILQEKR